LFGHFNVLIDGITIAYNVKYLCTILSDGKLLFADWSDNKKLIIFNIDGTHSRDIGLTGKPYDIARLDGERIAVSFPEDYVVQIFDVIGNGYPIATSH
jgi:hypothetical protein